MFLFEVFDAPILGLQSPNDDQSKPTWRTSRKTKLTLQQIRKLRKMLDVRTYENALYQDKIRKQYGAPAEGAQEGPPPF